MGEQKITSAAKNIAQIRQLSECENERMTERKINWARIPAERIFSGVESVADAIEK